MLNNTCITDLEECKLNEATIQGKILLACKAVSYSNIDVAATMLT